jgi:cytoskeleton protein RodZ
MSIVLQMPLTDECKERRLHLREVVEPEARPAVGQVLRARRLSLGLEEAAIASRLKIRRDQVAAIEACNYASLPGRAYALGYIRSYAGLLGLDADAIIESFKSEAAAQQLGKPPVLVFPDTQGPRGWPTGRLLAAGGVAAALLYGFVHLLSPAPAPVAAPLPPESSVTVVDAVPVPPPVRVPPSPTVATPAPPVAAEAASPVPAPANQDVAPVLPVPARAARITLTATAPTYVQVKDPSLPAAQSILVARLLVPGETFAAPDREGLLLLTGNAGGLRIDVDGRNAGVLGKSGEVIRRLPLDPAYFLSRVDTSR